MTRDEADAWITFLLIQCLRTPTFMEGLASDLKSTIESYHIAFGTDPASLARAYETLFSSDDIHRRFFRSVDKLSWSVLKAAENESFITSDLPLVVINPPGQPEWGIVFPLSPKRVFVVGWVPAAEEWPVKTRYISLPPGAAHQFNSIIVAEANCVVVSRPEDLCQGLMKLVAHSLGTRKATKRIQPWWGRLDTN